MRKILIAVDHFSEEQFRRIREAVAEWADIEGLVQASNPSLFEEKLRSKEIVVGWPRANWLIGTNVVLLQIGSSGWDAYQNQGLEESGIKLCTGRGIYTTGVAEHCIAMMFALVRKLPVHFRDKQEKLFRRALPYGEVSGTSACVVGMGDIGVEVAKRCKALGMRVVGVVRDCQRAYAHTDEVYHISALRRAVTDANHIFVTVSGGEENRNLISADILQSLRSDAYFYNVSRGITVDEKALGDLIAAGKIAGAGLDVATVEPLPDTSPLWSLGDNVLITGHSAGFSLGFPERFCQLVIRNLSKFHNNEQLENQVMGTAETPVGPNFL